MKYSYEIAMERFNKQAELEEKKERVRSGLQN